MTPLKKRQAPEPWVVVSPEGVFHVGLHASEKEAWMVALIFRGDAEIKKRKAEGWYAAPAQLQYTKPC